MANDIGAWLEKHGLAKYADLLAASEIELATLPHLGEGDLKELGLPMGPRKKLLAAIATLEPADLERVETPAAPSEGERRQLTVMFVDLVGSTALSTRLDLEALRDVLGRYQNLVAGEVARYEGHVARFMGDGVLIYFGYPTAHEDNAERAVRAGLDIAAAVGREPLAGERLEVRIGAATGRVVVGDLVVMSRDSGAIYVGNDAVTGVRFHHNWLHDTQTLVPGPADNFPMSGVYLDEGASGFEIDNNVLWNNQYKNIDVSGSFDASVDKGPNNNHVHNNTIPDVSSDGYIWVWNVKTCGTTQIVDNLVLVPVLQQGTTIPPCTATNNGPTAPGATEMVSAVQVGCNFAGCSSAGPPAISGGMVAASIAVQPYDLIVAAGQPATFSARGAGSAALTYQWFRHGVPISGATNNNYTLGVTSASDHGAILTVSVSNAIGSQTSSPAKLSVE